VTDIEHFMEQLSSSSPVPGGGSVAALQCAMAAALLAMVANLTIGRKKYADVAERANQIRDEALALRKRASRLADDDVEAYAKVSQVLEMPRDTDKRRDGESACKPPSGARSNPHSRRCKRHQGCLTWPPS
jgi:formiminotetrahydrofolate cyclodeaminase